MVYSIMHLNLVHGCTMYYLATVANQVEVVYNHLLTKTHLSYVELVTYRSHVWLVGWITWH